MADAAACPPPLLFRRLDDARRLRELETLKKKSEPFELMATAPDDIALPHATLGNVNLRVLRSEYEIVMVGRQMSNCASDYAENVRNGECILVAMYKESEAKAIPTETRTDGVKSEALALGMLNKDRMDEWAQLYGKRNTDVTSDTRLCYDRARPELAEWMHQNL